MVTLLQSQRSLMVTAQIVSGFSILLFSGCAFIISHHDSSEYPIVESTLPRPEISLSVKSYLVNHYYSGQEDCQEDSRLRSFLIDEVRTQNIYDIVPNSDTADIALTLCFHIKNDAVNMTVAHAISGYTLCILPSWFSRNLALDVNVNFLDGRNIEYQESDSYTAICWLPLMPFALIWSPLELKNMVKSQFRRVLIDIQALGTIRYNEKLSAY